MQLLEEEQEEHKEAPLEF